jgi:hypothetical protein
VSTPALIFIASTVLGLVFAIGRDEYLFRQCRDLGHLWERRVHPFTGLITAKCRRCRRWSDG